MKKVQVVSRVCSTKSLSFLQVGIIQFGVCKLKSHTLMSCKVKSQIKCLKVDLSQEDDVVSWDHTLDTLDKRVATT